MADESNPAFDADEIGKLILKAKTGGDAFSFAFGLASRPEDCALLVHRLKGPKVMLGQLKQLPGRFSRRCFGTFTVAGNEVLFAPLRPAKGMIKSLRRRFREEGMGKYKPILVGPDGAEIDEDTLPDTEEVDDDEVLTEVEAGETETAEAPEGTPGEIAPEPPAPDLAALRQRLAALLPRVAEAPAEAADRLRQACRIAAQQIAESQAEPAARTLDQIEAALARLLPPRPDETPVDAEAQPNALARLREALAKVVARIAALHEGDERKRLGDMARTAAAAIAQGEAEQALGLLRQLAQALAALEAGGTAPGTTAGDPMIVWRDAKEDCDTGISALQSVLRRHDDPDLTRIADLGLHGLTDGLQSRLMAALMDFRNASGEGRPIAGAKLATAAAELRDRIQADPVIALCEDNPFGIAVSIRAPLSAALTEVERIAHQA